MPNLRKASIALAAGLSLSLACWLRAEHLLEQDQALLKERLLTSEFLPVQQRAEQFFRLAWQTNRTIGQLPSFQAISGGNRRSDTEDIVAAGRISKEGVGTAQQLYNNLASNVSVSEVYCILDGFRPEGGEIPFLMYDELVVGNGQDRAAEEGRKDDAPEELETEEYAHYQSLLASFAKSHSQVHLKNLSEIPAASSPLLRTCDNSQYDSKTEGDPIHASGFAYSSPFWSRDGKFKGVISSIFRTDVLTAMLFGIPLWPVTAADSSRMRSEGWKVSETPGDFVLVNASKKIVAGGPRACDSGPHGGAPAPASFFPAIVMGIFSKKMNKEGAIAGMVVGLAFTFSYIVYFKFINPTATAADWWFGISPEGIGTLGMLFNFAAAVIVAKLTSAPPERIQHLVEDIRVPRGAGAAIDH